MNFENNDHINNWHCLVCLSVTEVALYLMLLLMMINSKPSGHLNVIITNSKFAAWIKINYKTQNTLVDFLFTF